MSLDAQSNIDGLLPWERAQKEGWEGVIAKRRDSLYEHRRSPHWLKMKCEMSQELVVGGFTDPQGKRVGLGALLVGYFDGDDLVFAGKIGTGFDTKLLLDLRAQLDQLEIPKAPFTRAVGLPRLRAHWVRPEIVVQVGFIEWTVHGKLRHPRLLGVRSDQESSTDYADFTESVKVGLGLRTSTFVTLNLALLSLNLARCGTRTKYKELRPKTKGQSPYLNDSV